MAQGEVITFYSYKGGVGRSMALANAATLLAQDGDRVLAMDFDLEAPGLLRYFKRVESTSADALGVIEFFSELRRRFEDLRGRSGGAASSEELPADALGPELETELRESVVALVEDPRFFRRVTVANPNLPGETAQLSLMPAGHYDASYPDRVRKFPWEAFYEAHPYFVEFLIDALTERYDYVLVDSRTGTTDVGNLCTVLLPEKLVLVSTPNEQSLNGATEVGRQAVEMRKASADLRPLPLFPLLSRVENAEDALQRTWLRDAKSRFEAVFFQVYGIQKPLTVYFDTVQIPHKSFYAYGEVIAAERERLTEARSLVAAYREFVEALRSNNAVDAQEVMSARLISPSKAQEVASAAQQRTVLLAEKVLAAEARSQDLADRLQQVRPSTSNVLYEATAPSHVSVQGKVPVARWLRAAAPVLVLLVGSAVVAIEATHREKVSPPAPADSPPANTVPPAPGNAPVNPFDNAKQPSSPGRAVAGAAGGTAPAVGPNPELSQIVRGDFQREKIAGRVSGDTFSGRAWVLGSYASPTQARTNLALVRNTLGDAHAYYSTNRFYALAVPAAPDPATQTELARRVSPDAYLYDAHGWLRIDFK